MKKLIPMYEFVLDKQRFKEDSDVAIFNVTNYANALSLRAEKKHFVPCDEFGNVLNKPTKAMLDNYKNSKEGSFGPIYSYCFINLCCEIRFPSFRSTRI